MSKERKEGNQDAGRLDDYKCCFACGVNNPIGLRMKVQYAPESARSHITLPPQFEGWKNIIHGGIVATLLDEIMAHAVLHHVGDAVTTTLTVSYRSALKVGQQVEVIGRVKERNRRSAVAEAEMRTLDDGKLLAKAKSRFILLSGLLPGSAL